MRPEISTGAHTSSDLAELICSNSLGSKVPDRASGILNTELDRLGSMLLDCARKTAIPAGSALAVDRRQFSRLVTDRIDNHPNITVVRQEVTKIPSTPTIIASGPLTSPNFAQAITTLSGEDHLFFYDAIAPIVTGESINMDIAFRASRYGDGSLGEGDYINCPFTEGQYAEFVDALSSAERIEIKSFERDLEKGVKAGYSHFFEGCLPVEIIAGRGRQSLAFGPMRPVGLTDPHTGRRPYAVVQLRQENLTGDLYNLVGFQTNLKFPEQKRVLALIPGLEKAEIVRFGQMHRNTFIASPRLLKNTLQFHNRADLFFAGQITGVEGYLGNIATGLLAGINAHRVVSGVTPISLPPTTMLGALCNYITTADLINFQPMKANLGILAPLNDRIKSKSERAKAYAERSEKEVDSLLAEIVSGRLLMKKKIILLSIPVILLTAVGAYLLLLQPNEPVSFDGNRAYADVEKQLSFGPRTPGSAAHQNFIAWLTEELKNSGWQSSIQQGEMLGNPVKNIIAHRGEESPEIILVAHYDSRLFADNDPDPELQWQPVPGANDGASGVAVLVELARVLPDDTLPIWLLFTDAEDNGRISGWDWILGARYFVSNMKFHPKAVIVVDMIGDRDLNIYKELNSDPELTSQIWEVAKSLGYEAYFINEQEHNIIDDHLPFVEAGIPAVDIIDIDYSFWHTSQDTLDKISADSLAVVGETLLQWILMQNSSTSHNNN